MLWGQKATPGARLYTSPGIGKTFAHETLPGRPELGGFAHADLTVNEGERLGGLVRPCAEWVFVNHSEIAKLRFYCDMQTAPVASEY